MPKATTYILIDKANLLHEIIESINLDELRSGIELTLDNWKHDFKFEELCELDLELYEAKLIKLNINEQTKYNIDIGDDV